MNRFSFLFILIGLLGPTYLSTNDGTESKNNKASQPKYIVSMRVEEVNSEGLENKVIACPTFECEDGLPTKLSISSSNFENSINKSIDIEARINTEE